QPIISAVVDLKTEVQFAELISKYPMSSSKPTPHGVLLAEQSPPFTTTTQAPIPFTRLSIDDCDELARKLGVRSIPAFYFFMNGDKAGNIVGVDPFALEKLVQAFSNEARETQGDIEAPNDEKTLNSHP
ncbi:hypothetical protein CEP53_015410, partial [Fusarium sp. AF-6]